MRVGAATVVVLISLCSQLQAANFSCEFSSGGTGSANPCSVNSTTSASVCQQKYSTIYATCQGGALGAGSTQLVCYFSTPDASAPTLGNSVDRMTVTKAFAQQPGFRTVAIEFITPSSGDTEMSLAYVEKQGASPLVVLCSPQ